MDIINRFDLPMSFGHKAKIAPSNLKAKLDRTKRDEAPEAPVPAPAPTLPETSSEAGPSAPQPKIEDDEDDIGPVPPKRKAEGEADEDEDSSEDEPEYEEEQDMTPISHEIILKDHTKVVTAIAVDPSGARVASGSHDYDCKLWDFGGMDARMKPFKSWEPNGNYHIHDMDYSSDGHQLLVISGTNIPKVFNRDGEEEVEYNKGDVYIRDMHHTNGHTAEINNGKWHPTDPTLFLTCSNDSTLRIWSTSNTRKQKQVIVVKSKEKGARTRVTACAWSPNGKMIAGACLDGSLYVWNVASNFARSNYTCENAHPKNTETSCVAFSRDGKRIASRGGDDTVKMWEIKSMRKPIATAFDLGNIYPETNLIFSPDDRSILTGTAVRKGSGDKGTVVFLDALTLAEQRRVSIGDGTVVRVLWQSRINQLFATLSTGSIHVLYSPHSSIRGALLPLAKVPKTAPRDISFTTADLKPVIFTPDALPMFADEKYGTSLHQKEKRSKKFKPMEPVSGQGKGGRVGQSAMTGLAQQMFGGSGIPVNEDPREALLKYADKTDESKK